MPKGKKDTIKTASEEVGESVNQFVNTAIDMRMYYEERKREEPNTPPDEQN